MNSIYVIDINRSSIKEAMHALGIYPEELLKKTKEDFADKRVTPDIQEVRFNYYKKKLKKILSEINDYIQKEKSKTSLLVNNGQVFLTNLTTCEEIDAIKEAKKKAKSRLEKSLHEEIGRIEREKSLDEKLGKSDRIRERVRSQAVENRRKVKKYKEMQRENYSKIEEEQEKRVKKFDEEWRSLSKRRENWVKNDYLLKGKEDVIEDKLIEKQMFQFEEKMRRSQINHEKILKEKIGSIKKKNFSPQLIDDGFVAKKLLEILEKQKKVENRRKSLAEEQKEYRLKIKEKKEYRRSLAIGKIKERETSEEIKAENLEKKMRASQEILKDKHEKWVKEMIIRNELTSFRDDEALMNAERKKRIMKYKNEQVLEKHLKDKERFEVRKEELNCESIKKRDIAVRKMIENERLNKKIEIIRKSPESIAVKNIFAEFGIPKKKEEDLTAYV